MENGEWGTGYYLNYLSYLNYLNYRCIQSEFKSNLEICISQRLALVVICFIPVVGVKDYIVGIDPRLLVTVTEAHDKCEPASYRKLETKCGVHQQSTVIIF